MFPHTLLLKRKSPVAVSTLLFGWMVFNSSTPALAERGGTDGTEGHHFLPVELS